MNQIKPLVSVVIPSFDGYRNGCLPKLLESFKEQSFQDFEVILMQGYNRQGKAINEGVRKSRGQIIIIFDDDTILGHKDVFINLVSAIKNDSAIGMAGVSRIIPENAPWFVRRSMREMPRQCSEVVKEVTDSDMAEHPCCAIPKKIFWQAGGESEVIPVGLDPYLRHKIRQAGYRVVVIPDTWIYHLLPNSFNKLMKRYFKKGKIAAYCNKFYPELIYDQAYQHDLVPHKKLPFIWRICRYAWRILVAFFTFRWIWLSIQVSNILGFAWGWLFAKEE